VATFYQTHIVSQPRTGRGEARQGRAQGKSQGKPRPSNSALKMAAPAPNAGLKLQSESQPDLIEAGAGASQPPPVVDIKPLLSRLWPREPDVTASEISDAIEHFFTDRIDDVQTGALLMCLHFTGLDRDPEVLSQCAQKMLRAAAHVDSHLLQQVIEARGRREGSYAGGFVSQLARPPRLTT
jgi:hypothetical protein